MKITDLDSHDRPREKLQAKGATALSDVELLAVILGRGSRSKDVLSVSKEVVAVIDSKNGNLRGEDLLQVSGLGVAKAGQILAAIEFAKRRILPSGVKITCASDIVPLFSPYAALPQEHFLCVTLNGANEVIKTRVVTVGLVNKTQVHPRETFADAITDRAASIIVAHNHPTGDLQPSREDISITQVLQKAGELLGIKVLDHIIFSKRGYYSLLDHGQMT